MVKWVKGTKNDFGCDENDARFIKASVYHDITPPKSCANCKIAKWVDSPSPYPTCKIAEDKFNACITGENGICKFHKQVR